MQKNELYILNSFCNITVSAYTLRTRFFPDMQLLQKHIAIPFGPHVSCLPNYLDNKYRFPKSGFATF